MRRSIAELTAAKREEILRQNWFSHDARWFLKVSEELGFEVGNRLNQIVCKSMGKTEMKRLAEAIGIEKVSNIEELNELIVMAGGFYVPQREPYSDQNSGYRIVDKDSMIRTTTKCVIADMVRQSGPTNLYECACTVRMEGWLEALGLEGMVSLDKSMLKGDPLCEIVLKITKWDE